MAHKKAGFDGVWPELIAVAGGFLLGCWANPHIEPLLAPLLTDQKAEVFGAILGVQGALLGFVLAALSIILGFSQAPQLKPIRDSGHLPTLFEVYMAGIRAHALSTIVALLALLLSTQNPLTPLLAWLVTTTCILAFVRLFRTLWATKNVVQGLSKPAERKPGQR
jgi:hypothetical protein